MHQVVHTEYSRNQLCKRGCLGSTFYSKSKLIKGLKRLKLQESQAQLLYHRKNAGQQRTYYKETLLEGLRIPTIDKVEV